MSDHGLSRSNSNATTRPGEDTSVNGKNFEAKQQETDQDRAQNSSSKNNGNISQEHAYWKGPDNQQQAEGKFGPGMGYNPFFPPIEGAGTNFPLLNGEYHFSA